MVQPSQKFFVIFPVGNGCLFLSNGCVESLVDGEKIWLDRCTDYN